ncbi:MAG: hypothetical protein EOP91_10790 [Lysobacteraceae bacterium]|nr:MAG: hypothetical protein EOP91_10790 [Xanthomonadaceae bacterium]
MNTRAPDPLTPEERELAQLVARLGPHGEPPAALDARILASARAAVQPRPASTSRPRWPVAIGLAASVVVAVGIAWQLRPLPQLASVGEVPEAHRPMAAAPAAGEPTPVSGALPEPAPEPPPVPVIAEAAPPSAATPAPLALPEPAPARQQRRLPSPRTVQRETRPLAAMAPEAASVAPPAPAPPPPAAPSPFAATEAEPGDTMGADAAANAVVRREQPIDAQAASAHAAGARAASARQASAPASRKAAALAGQAMRDSENQTLDRVEVTGSRISRTDRQVPVRDDTQLAVDDWLERVRTRYGLGDADAARQSLLLFVRDHPDETVPDDLEPLLEE